MVRKKEGAVDDCFIPNDLSDLDELWRKAKKSNINELRVMKSGSDITQQQFVGLRVIGPIPKDREEFGTMKAKYGLKKTWNKAKIIVKSDREALM